MIQELVELAERRRRDELDKTLVHDALCRERLDAYICITPDGRFLDIIPTEKRDTIVEDLVRTENKGRTSNVLARLLLDNEKYVLGLPETDHSAKCMKAYLGKLHQYENISAVKEVINFYEKNKEQGLKAARKVFESRVQSKELKSGTNFSFLVRRKDGNDTVVHSASELIEEIRRRYEENEKKLKGSSRDSCSICGKSEYRVRNLSTHGTIAGVLPRNSLGNYLIAYEGNAFSSYGLEGNDNSLVCTHCAKAYVEAMNWLLAPHSWVSSEKKRKPRPVFKNRKDISDDTAVVFWLKEKSELSDLELLDAPNEAAIQALFDSVTRGKATATRTVDTDLFYALTISGSAARIAVRDWIETSVENLRKNLAQWFRDVEIGQYDKESKTVKNTFPRLWELVRSVKGKSANKVQHGRIGVALWRCAVLGMRPPLWIIGSILNRIRAEQSAQAEEGKFSIWELNLPERISLLRLCLNRKNNQKEGVNYMATLDEANKNIAYVCGRIFAVLESIQYHASGGNLNAGIRERFFSFASTMPSTAFGRLMKLTQHHLSKISGESPGLAINLDKKLQELMMNIEGSRFPVVFSLEDQGSFAIGYYHQRQEDFSIKPNKKEN